MSTSRLCSKFEVRSSFRLGCRVVTDIQTDKRQTELFFQKTLFRTRGPLKRVENGILQNIDIGILKICDPIAILSIPYILYQVIESNKQLHILNLNK